MLAAQQVLHTACNNLEQFSARSETPQSMLEASLSEAHMLIKASRFINEKDPHSTAVMLLLQPGRITWGHCGDSRLYHFRGTNLVNRSGDHSYVEYLISTGKITAEQALTHPNRNVLLASLGGQDDPKIALDETSDLAAGDAFVLCSDGLWAYFDDIELGVLIAQNSARQACEVLIDKARRRANGSGDNLSLAIIKLIDALPSKSTLRI